MSTESPLRIDIEQRRIQLGDAQTARRVALDLFATEVANVIGEASGKDEPTIALYRVRIREAARHYGSASNHVEGSLLDTITLMLMYQSMQVQEMEQRLITEIRQARVVNQ